VKRRGLVAVIAALGALAVAGCAATTDPASDVTASSATLRAAGRTDSTPAHYFFQYSVNPSALGTGFGQQTPTRGPIPAGVQTSGGGLVPFSEAVSGLKPGTTYYYRVCGGDGQTNGDVCAQVRSFTTPPGAVFNTPGTYSWTVPAGVSTAMFDVYGAGGGTGGAVNIGTGECFTGAGPGGLGAHVRATMSLHAGEVLTIVVGGQGGDATPVNPLGCAPGGGGSNGGGAGAPGIGNGGGGGGASDVRTGPGDPSGLSTRLLVAGAGGGDTPTFLGTTAAGNGGLIGSDGQSSPQGGGGGTATAGGAGGAPNGGGGALGLGGDGGSGFATEPYGGGGGGAGLYGGGGGGGGGYYPGHQLQGSRPGGGGGGSSLATSNTTCQATVSGGIQSGDGAVTITYNPGACP
jgi:hypothetical protein